MREIRFKAYDKTYKKIFEVSFIDWDGNTILIRGIPKELNSVIDFEYRNFDQVELIQFTGLFDKNGKEIWGGDIFENDRFTSFVIFENGGFKGRHSFNKIHIPYGFDFNDYEARTGKVIGNIYENPELIKEI